MSRLDLKGKKLLVLAGGGSHYKLVKAAKELGVYTIVVDYLEPSLASPSKMISDENWNLSVLDSDAIVKKCKENLVDGVITGWNDISQIPYCKICRELGLPSYGNEKQFYLFTNKKAFKQLCKDNGINVIDEYSKNDVENGFIEYPVFVKPVDSRGSRGQSICNNYDELQVAIEYAEKESLSGEILIEHYVANTNSFQVTYFFIEGEPYIVRTADGYKGTVNANLDRVALCSISPSIYTNIYMKEVNDKFIHMMKKCGIKNGPVMAQGFFDNGIFRFYDPGLRFPGVDYEVIYKDICGIDFMSMMVEFALTGKMNNQGLKNDNVFLDGNKVAVLFPTVYIGEIGCVNGFEKIRDYSRVHSALQWYETGDVIENACVNTIKQRIAEIDLLGENFEELKNGIRYVQNAIEVKNVDGKDMMYMPFDVEKISTEFCLL